MSAALTNPSLNVPANFPNGSVGAVVVGGDYQGLGIVRSLGSRGIPVCVVDDEYSISRFSRYSTHNVKVANLRDERAAVAELIRIGKTAQSIRLGPLSDAGGTGRRIFAQPHDARRVVSGTNSRVGDC